MQANKLQFYGILKLSDMKKFVSKPTRKAALTMIKSKDASRGLEWELVSF